MGCQGLANNRGAQVIQSSAIARFCLRPSLKVTLKNVTMPDQPLHRTRIWDLPTRLFHAGLLLAVAGLVSTGLLGGSAMVWHFRCGQAVMALLMFRVLWGFWGGRWSRFSAMWFSPWVLWTYLKAQGGLQLRTGHSPMGSLSVLAFLVVLSAQVATGLVSDDEIATMGPLSHLVSNAVVAAATAFHTQWGKLKVTKFGAIVADDPGLGGSPPWRRGLAQLQRTQTRGRHGAR